MLFFLLTCIFFSFFSLVFPFHFNIQLPTVPSNNVMWFLKTSLWTSSERPLHCRPGFCTGVFVAVQFSSVQRDEKKEAPMTNICLPVQRKYIQKTSHPIQGFNLTFNEHLSWYFSTNSTCIKDELFESAQLVAIYLAKTNVKSLWKWSLLYMK